MPDSRIRPATPADTRAVLRLVYELAEYEKATDECTMTERQLRGALFAAAPALFCHVAEVGGAVVGCALWFLNFSTWDGTHGIYVEDLYVSPEHRGHGMGRALLAALAEECAQRGYLRLQWQVLNWNAPSIAFYESLGARAMDEWTVFRLAGDALRRLGKGRDYR